ncbi:MAG: hypothetical protein LBK72_07675, partial [Bifidobacteriaceae bacterium]|nr:hypothetical protein [Bifidobacteriaceae bacterium]
MTTNPPAGPYPDQPSDQSGTPIDPPDQLSALPHQTADPAGYAVDPTDVPIGPAAPVAGLAPDPSPRRLRRRRTWIIAGAVAAAVVLAGGGTAAALLAASSLPHGASSPEGAVTAFVKAVQSKRLPAMGFMLAPSEVGLIRQAMADVRPTDGAPSPSPDQAEALAAAWDSVTIDTSGMETSSEQIAEGVAVVTLTSGSITIDADTAAVGRLIDTAGAASGPLAGLSSDLPATEAEEALADLADSLPYTITAADIADDAGFLPRLVAVEEEGKWYVSAAMSLAELVFANAATDNPALQRGTPLSAAERGEFTDAEGAADQFVTGLSEAIGSGDVRALAAALPTAEARLLAVYGPAVWGSDGVPGAVTVDALSFTPVSDDGGRVRFG